MIVIKTEQELKDWLKVSDRKNKSLGFVPTMGFLHEGHLSLIRRSVKENDLTVVSIFVNPMQFSPNEDFDRYPRDIERDCALAEKAGADVVFYPDACEIYPTGFCAVVELSGPITKKLCGISRPTHFKGVTTVVNILFNIVSPDRAYFGQKDAQQAIVIKQMVRQLHMPVEIRVCPIVREEDGLALSSRNVFLSPEERAQAVCLNLSLKKAEEYFKSGATDAKSTAKLKAIILEELAKYPLAQTEYAEVLDGQTLDEIEYIPAGGCALAAVAVRFSNTRLIDNIVLSEDNRNDS